MRYGLPKDWDTIAVVYNRDILAKAGVTQEEMDNLTWNPEDGGSFEQVLARLSLDKNGNNGLSPDFDRDNVTRWGMAMDYVNMGAYGQQMWSTFTASTGWKYNDGMYATKYYYDDPRFIRTLQWLADLSLVKGYMTPFEAMSNFSANSLFTSQEAALTLDGSWMIGFYSSNTDFSVGFARLPRGPMGRKSMFNGLADSIWVGTKHPAEAWRWVKYLGSAEAQDVVGGYGAVFPAIESGVQAAVKAYTARNLDITAFTAQALEKEGTFLFPITDNGAEISSIMQQASDSVFLGQKSAQEAFTEANARVNATFK
jgi:multiple sugar transport system substrate-binding protein